MDKINNFLNNDKLNKVLASSLMEDAALILDFKGRVADLNEAAKSMLGYPEDDAAGMDASSFFLLDDANTSFLSHLLDTSAAQGRMDISKWMIRRNGSQFLAELRLIHVAPSESVEAGYILFVKDITNLRQERAEKELSRYRILAEQAQDILLFIRREDGSLIEVNQAAVRAYGYSQSELLQMTFNDVQSPDDPSPFDLSNKRDYSSVAPFDTLHRRKDGSQFPVEISLQAATIGEEDLLLAIIRDISRRKMAEKAIQHQLRRLSILWKVDSAIAISFNMRFTLTTLLELAKVELGVDAADILLFPKQSQVLEYAAGWGFGESNPQFSGLNLDSGVARQVILKNKTLQLHNLPDSENILRAGLFRSERFEFYCATPLVIQGRVRGVLETFHRTLFEPEQEWLDFLETLAGQAAIAVENSELFEGFQRTNLELAQAYDATIEGWSRGLDIHDKETEGHTRRVTDLTLALGRRMGADKEALVQMRRGALLHDIGKMGISDNILHKRGQLTEEEWEIMRKHPIYAYDLISPIQFLSHALDIPYCHHERWDGSGYPRGIRGKNIPWAARLFSVVDVWDSLRSDRPYRMGWPDEDVREYIDEQSGTMFDPQVVDIFRGIMENESFMPA